MPRSIDTHQPGCACPACQYRQRGEEQRILLGVRISADAHALLMQASSKAGMKPGELLSRWIRQVVGQHHEVYGPSLGGDDWLSQLRRTK